LSHRQRNYISTSPEFVPKRREEADDLIRNKREGVKESSALGGKHQNHLERRQAFRAFYTPREVQRGGKRSEGVKRRPNGKEIAVR